MTSRNKEVRGIEKKIYRYIGLALNSPHEKRTLYAERIQELKDKHEEITGVTYSLGNAFHYIGKWLR